MMLGATYRIFYGLERRYDQKSELQTLLYS